ncbi:exodeoxyribonuclease VIII [Salmonella enterica]|nr:exodeoxyribonuclease VIII [Salmonella enterica]EAX7746753.1 exodeoxyribonuclease VIII [Salmonella enterica]EAX7760529.1 exodeoxyribonuclease VIII [Salmonella enterica]EBP1125753.1 exodeoxyribonuclease VIII [Salmonella enterica]EBP1188725.1 exodeoxyribonuclease VIII [Salmonella enterica]
MSNDKEDFALHCPVKNEEARKRLGIKAGFFWTTAKKLSVAVSRCIAAMDDKGYDEDDFKKPVRVNLPAIGDLPPEGAFDTEFCNRYEKGGEDGKTMMLIPGAVPADQFHGESVENTAVTSDTPANDTVTDSDDTAGDPLPAYAYNVNGELMSDVEKQMLQPVASMGERHRILSQFILEGEFSHRITPEQLSEVSSLELDMSNSYIQDMLLACHNVPGIQNLDNPSLWKFTDAFKRIFPQDKRHTLHMMMNFAQAYADAHPIDRALLAKEWQKGNRVSCINRTPSGANAGGGIQSDRKMPQTTLGLEFEIALGLLARKYEFDIYSLPLEIELKANAIMNAVDDPEWLATRELFVSMPGGLDYSRACVIATVKTTQENLYESPFRHREYLNKVLTETDHANPDPLVVNIACGRSSMSMPMKGSTSDDEEKPQSAGAMADEPAASEAVEQDTTEHHPDPQQVETEPPVSQTEAGYQKIRAELHAARKNIPPKNPVDVGKQLAAARGEYVEGISDPNDPKWIHNDYNASNEGEKTEVATDATDSVDHSEAFSNQYEPESNHSEPVADQNEPEMPEVEPEVSTVVPAPQPEWPTYFEYGRYEGLPNCAYHAADGISSTMLKDARISLMYFYGRYIAGTIKRETSDAFTMGSLVHSLILEPAKFDEEYAVFPGIPAGAFTNTDSLKAFIREYNADKPKSEQLKLTGKKEDLQEAIRAVKPEAIFADEYEQQWLENIGNKTVLTGEQLRLAKAMQQAVLSDSVAGYYVNYPSRSVEVSYFGMDEDTEMDVRVRPDLEITVDNERIGIDLKTISMGRVRQDVLRARLHREIIDRDYHISAAMYSDVANLNKFFWIFVNKDEGYHWVAVVEASSEEIELGRLEYRKTMQSLKQAYDSGVWPAPITEQYTDNLNDYDLRRLEMLSGLV